jgi:hypothetical protein
MDFFRSPVEASSDQRPQWHPRNPVRSWLHNFCAGKLPMGVKSCWRDPSMRIFTFAALCFAGVLPLSATGQAARSTTSSAPAKSVQQQNAVEHNTTVLNSPAQVAPRQTAPKETTPPQRAFPQLSFDKGIYAGRELTTGTRGCLAIQSYNFSQAPPGKMPKLESITTCTPASQPLLRRVEKPEAENQQGQQNQK